LITPRRIRRKQKQLQKPLHALDPGIHFSQASCTEYVDQSFDVAQEEVNGSAANISLISLDTSCGFLDLEEVAVDPAEGRVHDAADSDSDQTKRHQTNDASDQQSADAAATDGAVSPMNDACDKDKAEDDIETDRCTIKLLDSPQFITDQTSCFTTPASFINWNADVDADDTLSLLDCDDLFQDDDNLLSGDADLLTQSKLTNPANECHGTNVEEFPDEYVCSTSVGKEINLRESEKKHTREEINEITSRHDIDMKDPADDECVILLSNSKKTDSTDVDVEEFPDEDVHSATVWKEIKLWQLRKRDARKEIKEITSRCDIDMKDPADNVERVISLSESEKTDSIDVDEEFPDEDVHSTLVWKEINLRQSEKKHARKEIKEITSRHDIDMKDPADDECVILLSDSEKTDSIDIDEEFPDDGVHSATVWKEIKLWQSRKRDARKEIKEITSRCDIDMKDQANNEEHMISSSNSKKTDSRDDDVEEFPDEDICSTSVGKEINLQQSKKKHTRKEIKEITSRHDIDMKDPADDEEHTISLSNSKKMDSTDDDVEEFPDKGKEIKLWQPRKKHCKKEIKEITSRCDIDMKDPADNVERVISLVDSKKTDSTDVDEEFHDEDVHSTLVGKEINLWQSEMKCARKEITDITSRCDIDMNDPADNVERVISLSDSKKTDSTDVGVEEFSDEYVRSTSVWKEIKLQQSANARNEIKENTSRCDDDMIDPADNDERVISLSHSKKRDSTDGDEVKVTSGNPESVTAVQPSQLLYTQQSSDVGNTQPGSGNQTDNNDLVHLRDTMCSVQNEAKTSEAVTVVVQHHQSLQPSTAAATDDREQGQNTVRKSLRLIRRQQVKANTTVPVMEVKTHAEPQLLQADAEILHDADKELGPKPLRRSLRTCRQQNKQVAQAEKSVNQASTVDSSGQVTYLNLMSQHEDEDVPPSEISVIGEKHLETKLAQRNLRTREQQKKQGEKSLNQTAKVGNAKPDTCLSFSSFQQAVVTEAAQDEDKQLKAKLMQRSSRRRGQLKKPTLESLDTKCSMKPHTTSPELSVCTTIPLFQQTDETNEPVTFDNMTGSQTTDINIELFTNTENGNSESVSPEETEKSTGQLPLLDRLTGSGSNSVEADFPVQSVCNVPYENDAASLTVQPTVGHSAEGVMSNPKLSSSVVSCCPEEIIISTLAEVCSSQNEILCRQLVVATEANAADNALYSTGVISDQEQNIDTAVGYVFSDTAATGLDIVTVKRATEKIPCNTVSPDVISSSFQSDSQTAANRPRKQRSSASRSSDFLPGVMTTGHAETSHVSNAGFFCAETMVTEPMICSTHITEAEQRLSKVMAFIAIGLNNEDEHRAELNEDAGNLNNYTCANSDIHEDVNHNNAVACQNFPEISSEKFAHIFPPVDSLLCKGPLHTSEDANEMEDSESRLVASQQLHRKKCSSAASHQTGSSLSQSLYSVLQTQQPVVNKDPEAVDYSNPEVNEIPSSLLPTNSQKQAACKDPVEVFSQLPASSQHHCQKKCSVVDSEYNESASVFGSRVAQKCCETQQQVLTAGVDYSSPVVDAIPNSLPDIYTQICRSNELQKQAVHASEQGPLVDDSELSQTTAMQQRCRQKCSFVASEYCFSSQEQVAGIGYSSPEVNEIPSSLPLTHSYQHSQKDTMHTRSSIAAGKMQPMVSLCRQVVDSAGASVATKSQLSLPDVCTHGNLSNFAFPRLHNTDAMVIGDRVDISAINDSETRDVGSDVNATEAKAPRRKVSEPQLIWMHASERQAAVHGELDDE